VLTALIVPLGMIGVFAAPASAEAGPECTGNTAKMKLSPGLTFTSVYQTITINGKLSGCTGGGVTSAKYTVKTSGPASCEEGSVLKGTYQEGTIVITWKGKGLPKGAGNSIGTFLMQPPIPPGPSLFAISGMIESGPFAESKIAGEVLVTLKGTCGAKKRIKSATVTESGSTSSY